MGSQGWALPQAGSCPLIHPSAAKGQTDPCPSVLRPHGGFRLPRRARTLNSGPLQVLWLLPNTCLSKAQGFVSSDKKLTSLGLCFANSKMKITTRLPGKQTREAL